LFFGLGFLVPFGRLDGAWLPDKKNGQILLANLRQSSRSTFSCGSFPSFFAFQEGIWDSQISALLGSPTVSGHFLGAIRMAEHGRSVWLRKNNFYPSVNAISRSPCRKTFPMKSWRGIGRKDSSNPLPK
jgi:hypothetical protein